MLQTYILWKREIEFVSDAVNKVKQFEGYKYIGGVRYYFTIVWRDYHIRVTQRKKRDNKTDQTRLSQIFERRIF